jgi:hypothetical protein
MQAMEELAKRCIAKIFAQRAANDAAKNAAN